jgi:hypothetical protein
MDMFLVVKKGVILLIIITGDEFIKLCIIGITWDVDGVLFVLLKLIVEVTFDDMFLLDD